MIRRLLRRATLLAALGTTAIALSACASAPGPGWTFAPPPTATPVPSPTPSAAASTEASAAPTSAAPSGGTAGGATVDIAALNVMYDKAELSAPAGQAFAINFDNQDAGIPHNVEIKDASGTSVFKGEIITGPTKATYQVPALAAGTYTFVCTVHPNMVGTLTTQ